jgi:hypothetical protein
MLGSSATTGFNIFNAPPAPTPITPQNATVRRNGVAIAPNRQLRTRSDYSLNTDYRWVGRDHALPEEHVHRVSQHESQSWRRLPAVERARQLHRRFDAGELRHDHRPRPARASAFSTSTPAPGSSIPA